MKKGILILLITGTVMLTGCGNRQILDTKWTFTKAKNWRVQTNDLEGH